MPINTLNSSSDPSTQDDDFDNDGFVNDDRVYDNNGYNVPHYALAANFSRLGYALARSHTQAAVGVSQIVGGVLTSMIDAANVTVRPFHPFAGAPGFDDPQRRERDRGPSPRSARDDDGRDRSRGRRTQFVGPAAATNVVNDGINRAVADALHTFSRAAEEFAQSYAPGSVEPRQSARDRAPDRDEPRRRTRSSREEVRRTGEQAADAVADAAARVESKTK